MAKTIQDKQIVLNRKELEELEIKASLFEEILSFIEDKYLGYLMQSAEKEKNIPASQAKKFPARLLKRRKQSNLYASFKQKRYLQTFSLNLTISVFEFLKYL